MASPTSEVVSSPITEAPNFPLVIVTCLNEGLDLFHLNNGCETISNRFRDRFLAFNLLWRGIARQISILEVLWQYLDRSHQRNLWLLLIELDQRLASIKTRLDCLEHQDQWAMLFLDDDNIGDQSQWSSEKYSSDEATLWVERTLQRWRDYFVPSWHLIAFNPSHEIDEILEARANGPTCRVQRLLKMRQLVQKSPPEDFPMAIPVFPERVIKDWQRLPSSSTWTGSITGRTFIIEMYDVWNSEGKRAEFVQQLLRFNRAFQKLDSMFDFPQPVLALASTFCSKKAADSDNYTKFKAGFEIPAHLSAPRSLGHLIAKKSLSVTERVDMASQLATALFYVHAAGIVHCNIRPENILIFVEPESQQYKVFLSGLHGNISTSPDPHNRSGLIKKRDIYRNPMLGIEDLVPALGMEHDIYSLGVCMLQMGLWNPDFTQRIKDQVNDPDERDHARSVQLPPRGQRSSVALLDRQTLIQTTRSHLYHFMGKAFADVVLKCLQLSDNGDDSPASRHLGVWFIEQVLHPLTKIDV